MKYNPSIGLFGNVKQLFTESNKTNNTVYNNKAMADQVQASNEDLMCELDSIDRIAEIEEALIELESMITEVQ